YTALALATLSLSGGLGIPAVAFAAQTSSSDASTTNTSSPAQTSDGAKAKKAATAKTEGTTSPTTLQTVVVTSFRQSINENLQDKRDSNSIVEVINAQNIAQFPAKNIADALA